MRVTPLFSIFLTTVVLTACDAEETIDRDATVELVEAEPEEEQVDPVLSSFDFDQADSLVSDPGPTGDQTSCATYYFTSRQNASKKTSCSASVSTPQYPPLINFDKLMQDELKTMAQATCSALGARDGFGNFPGLGGFGGLPGPGGHPGLPSLPGDPDALAADTAHAEAGAVAPLCQTLCAAEGKQWDSSAKGYGTCAFDLTYAINDPKKKFTGPACPGPGIQKWTSDSAVVFNCGCDCI